MRLSREFSILVGQTLKSVDLLGEGQYDEIVFTTTEDKKYKLYHHQDCCETVVVDDIVGELTDILGSPILKAEEVTEKGDDASMRYGEWSQTYTFYKIDTEKGGITIKWYGSSNGYYSEEVDFIELV